MGVKRNAKRADIKRAYYVLAKKYHPDVNPSAVAKKKFEEIQKSYEILSDSKQRDLYDLENDYSDRGKWKGYTQDDQTHDTNRRRRKRSGPASRGSTESQGFWDSNFDQSATSDADKEGDIFDEFFFTGKQSATPKDSDLTRGKDLNIDINIEFMDSIKGCNHTMKLVKNIMCETCKGTRANPDSSPSLCAE